MTLKEKAIELVDRYYSLFSLEFENTIDITQAKRCALIALDEKIETAKEVFDIFKSSDYKDGMDKYISDLKDLKQEIEKL